MNKVLERHLRRVEPRLTPAQRRAARNAARTVNLALQGGGAHGAFTWGVLERLSEEEKLAIEGISATSAGAMNATVFAYGMSVGGRDGARTALTQFWRRISHAAAFTALQPTAFDRIGENRALAWSPAFMFFDMMTRMLSPYQFNPLNFNPLRNALNAVVDFGQLSMAHCPIKLFLSATNVRTGKVKVFTNDEIDADAVLASGCLPFIFQAVEIDGEAYWDGGYMGNPAMFPLIYNCESSDIVIVHINPLERDDVPKTAPEIMNRINEISFNSSLMREMRAINFVTKLIDEGAECNRHLRRMLIHGINAEHVMTELSHASKLNADWEFLTYLRDEGREHAELWLDRNFDRLGRESTIDIAGIYL